MLATFVATCCLIAPVVMIFILERWLIVAQTGLQICWMWSQAMQRMLKSDVHYRFVIDVQASMIG